MLQGLSGVIISSVEMGLIFSILAIGVSITLKILKISDLSVDGTFPLGAFIFARLAMEGMPFYIGMVVATLGGMLGGFITYSLYKKVKIPAILAGILTQTMLYSINLRITGTSNVPLFDLSTIFNTITMNKIVLLALIVLAIKLVFDYFLQTEKGYLLIATGDNDSLVKSLGQNPDKYVALGLMLANGLVALSGSLMAQNQGFADAQMGISMIVNGLASIIIGETIFKDRDLKVTTRAILGAIIYRIIYGLAIHLGLNPNDLKLVTALIVIIFIAYNNFFQGRPRNAQN